MLGRRQIIFSNNFHVAVYQMVDSTMYTPSKKHNKRQKKTNVKWQRDKRKKVKLQIQKQNLFECMRADKVTRTYEVRYDTFAYIEIENVHTHMGRLACQLCERNSFTWLFSHETTYSMRSWTIVICRGRDYATLCKMSLEKYSICSFERERCGDCSENKLIDFILC